MRKSPLLVIFMTVVLDLVGFGIIIPLLPLYAKHFGANGTMVAVLLASYSLMQLFFAPIWGRLSDRIGRRPLLVMSILGNALALVVFGLANSYAWLLAARVIAGVCTANVSIAHAYVADVTSLRDRAKGMGMVGAAFGIGFVIGPFIGGELSILGYAAPPLFAAGLTLVNFVLAFFLLPESLPPEKRARERREAVWQERLGVMRAVPGLGSVLVLVFIQIFAFSMLETVFVLFANARLGFDVRSCGRVFAYIGVIMVIVQGGLIGRLARKYGEKRLIYAGLALVAAGMLLMPLTPGTGGAAWLLAFMTLVALGQGLATPSLSSLLSKRTPANRQGVALGLSQSASALARVTGPVGAGVLWDKLGQGSPFWAGGLLTVAACAAAWTLLRRPLAEPPQVPAAS